MNLLYILMRFFLNCTRWIWYSLHSNTKWSIVSGVFGALHFLENTNHNRFIGSNSPKERIVRGLKKTGCGRFIYSLFPEIDRPPPPHESELFSPWVLHKKVRDKPTEKAIIIWFHVSFMYYCHRVLSLLWIDFHYGKI